MSSLHSSLFPAVPSSLQAVLELFESELSHLKFPDLDCAVLQAAAERVGEQAAALRQAEAALMATRDALHETLEALQHKCQRALAYARVYAEDNPELLSKLESLELQRPRGPRGVAALPSSGLPRGEASPRPRRARRAGAGDDPLFVSPGAVETATSQAA